MSRVLIIDDDPLVRELVADMVQDLGHDCEEAGTRAQGLAMARESSFDVVFLDVNLPEGSGLDILADVQATAAKPEVIVITGAGETQVAEEAMRGGAWAFVPKPLSLKGITGSLDGALDHRAARSRSGQV